MKWFLPCLFCCSTLLSQDRDWNKVDTAIAAVYVASELADWSQTSQIHKYPNLWESNPALGEHPTQAQINNHFFRCIVTDVAIAYLLRRVAPKWVSRSFLIALTIRETSCIQNNYRNGIKIKLGFTF